VVGTSILAYKGHRAFALKIDHVSRVAFPVGFIALEAWALLL
jgi:hypothetical protein